MLSPALAFWLLSSSNWTFPAVWWYFKCLIRFVLNVFVVYFLLLQTVNFVSSSQLKNCHTEMLTLACGWDVFTCRLCLWRVARAQDFFIFRHAGRCVGVSVPCRSCSVPAGLDCRRPPRNDRKRTFRKSHAPHDWRNKSQKQWVTVAQTLGPISLTRLFRMCRKYIALFSAFCSNWSAC